MATLRNPHHGTMQYWPRKRAKRVRARVRSYPRVVEPGIIGFAGYKVGMTHLLVRDNRATSTTKDQDIFCPVTVIECPPLKLVSVRFYKRNSSDLFVANEIVTKGDKILARKIRLPRQEPKFDNINADDFADIRVIAQTQPNLTGIGKKSADLFEMQLGGNLGQKLDFARNNLGKDIKVSSILKDGQQVDAHVITKGKGFQGPVKRFGVKIRSHKAEKTKRGPANVGPWTGNRSWTVAHAGQMGYQQRMEHNKLVVKVDANPKMINVAGGFLHYGAVKNDYVLLKGSVAGPAKRVIRMIPSIRPNRHMPKDAPSISYLSLSSKR